MITTTNAADSTLACTSTSPWLPPMDSVDDLSRTGPIALPGSGRVVWWTGRVAIGLRYEAPVFGGVSGNDASRVID